MPTAASDSCQEHPEVGHELHISFPSHVIHLLVRFTRHHCHIVSYFSHTFCQ